MSNSASEIPALSAPITRANGTSPSTEGAVVKSPSSRSWEVRGRLSAPRNVGSFVSSPTVGTSPSSTVSISGRTPPAVTSPSSSVSISPCTPPAVTVTAGSAPAASTSPPLVGEPPVVISAGGELWGSVGSVTVGARSRSRCTARRIIQTLASSSYHDAIVIRVNLSDDVYARLLALRTGLRRFERWSEQQAQATGLTPAQHQLLLAVRGHDGTLGPTIGEVADYLLLRHHSAVGLVDRAEAAGLVYRTRDKDDHRIVRLHLTEVGADRIEALSALHLEELDRLALKLPSAWGRPRARAPVARVLWLSAGC